MVPDEKVKVRKFLRSKFTTAILIILCIGIVSSLWDTAKKTYESYIAKVVSEKEYVDIVERKKNLEYEIERKSTPRGIEEEIRLKSNFVREGEEVIVIVGEEKVASTTEDNLFKEWWKKFFR